MAQKSKHMLLDPRAIPAKAKNYAKYELVHVVNEFLDTLGLSELLLQRTLNKLLAVPAARLMSIRPLRIS